MILAHLAAQETRRDAASRQRIKLALIRRLHERGYSRERVLNLFRFIDWLLALPAEQEAQIWRAMEELEEERKMPYITSVERFGLERGLAQGRQEGLAEGKRIALRRIVGQRFGHMPESLVQRIAADDTALDALLDRVATVASADDL